MPEDPHSLSPAIAAAPVADAAAQQQLRDMRGMLQKAGGALQEAMQAAATEHGRAERLEQALRGAHAALAEMGAELDQARQAQAAAEARATELEQRLSTQSRALQAAEERLEEEARLRLSAEDRAASDRGWVITSIAAKNQAEGDLRTLLRAIEHAPGSRGKALRALHRWLAEQPLPPHDQAPP